MLLEVTQRPEHQVVGLNVRYSMDLSRYVLISEFLGAVGHLGKGKLAVFPLFLVLLMISGGKGTFFQDG